METPIIFKSGSLNIEGLLQRQPGRFGVVITHPHSLYGGEMYNSVVETICKAYAKKGYSTLRFNFRGVGQSEGVFDNGCGEGEDVLAAVQYLLQAGLEKLHLTGYSFGARVIAGISPPNEVISQTFIAPPVAFMDFSKIGNVPRLQTVITGENDAIAPMAEISKYLQEWNPAAQLHVLESCDHFFGNALDKLTSTLAQSITT